MLIRQEIAEELFRIVQLKGWDIPLKNICVEQPPKPEMGDFATTLPLILTRQLRRKPIDIASEIASEFHLSSVSECKPLPSGYINFFFSFSFLENNFSSLLSNPIAYLSNESGKGKKALVEFVSANPTGPLTVANGRSAPIGDTIANLLTLQGYSCDREFLINDMGTKALKLASSVYFYYQKAFGNNPDKPEEMYPGDYVEDLANKLKSEKGDSLLENSNSDHINEIKDFCIQQMIHSMKEDLSTLKVEFNSWFNESSLHNGYIEETFAKLSEQNMVLNEEGAWWLKTTDFGDDKNRVLIRSNGMPTYLMGDIAYHRNKLDRGYDVCVDIWGADQSHVKPLKWALSALGYDPNRLKTVTFQLVHLFRDNKEVKMSKSGGNYITLHNLLQEVGPDVSRFVYLSRSNEQHLNFDLDITKNRDPKNPVFYAQYAYTRCQGIKREAATMNIPLPENVSDIDFSLLSHASEKQALRRFSVMPELLDRACSSYSPHLITQDIQFVATDFHNFYEHCRVLNKENIEQSKARLLLVKGIESLLLTLFSIIGIDAPERM